LLKIIVSKCFEIFILSRLSDHAYFKRLARHSAFFFAAPTTISTKLEVVLFFWKHYKTAGHDSHDPDWWQIVVTISEFQEFGVCFDAGLRRGIQARYIQKRRLRAFWASLWSMAWSAILKWPRLICYNWKEFSVE
jgi:hypothetical protein